MKTETAASHEKEKHELIMKHVRHTRQIRGQKMDTACTESVHTD